MKVRTASPPRQHHMDLDAYLLLLSTQAAESNSKRVKLREDGVRMCGTAGCTGKDHHLGPCTTERVSSRRPHETSLPYNEQQAQRRILERIKRPVAKLRRQKPPPKEVCTESPPPEQGVLPSGLHRFYDPLRWGVPLPDGPVHSDPIPASWQYEADEWKLAQTADRIRGRAGVSDPAAQLMILWNAHIHRTDRKELASARGLPAVCRAFARAHADHLRAKLDEAFRCHLHTLTAHNLLHAHDADDCLVIAGAQAELCHACTRPLHEKHCALYGMLRGVAAWPVAVASESDILHIVSCGTRTRPTEDDRTACEICRSSGDDEKMLLCDGCDKAFHMQCLRPPLQQVPRTDWYCAPCIALRMEG